MKKVFGLILCILLIMASFTVVFADASISARPSSSNVYRGNTFDVTVYLSNTESIKSLGSTVSFDGSVLELVSLGGSEWILSYPTLMKNYIGVDGTVLLDNEYVVSGNILKLRFKVKDNAALGYSQISVGVIPGSGNSWVYASTGITVACNHVYGSGTTVSEPTCTKQGEIKYTCSICGNVKTDKTPAFGHTYGEWKTTKEAGCTEEGVQTRVCSICGNETTRAINPLGHELKDTTVIKESTCTEHGTAEGVCTRCGKNATVETPFASHTWGAWYETKAATCTAEGQRAHKCDVCGYVGRESSLPLGHDFSGGTLVSEANIYTQGVYEAYCTRCSAPGSVITPCSDTDKDTGIYFETETGVFPSLTQISVKELYKKIDVIQEDDPNESQENNSDEQTEIPELSPIEKTLNLVSREYLVYNIKALVDGDIVEQSGNVKIVFPLDEMFSRNVGLYRVTDDGVISELDLVIDTKERTAEINTEALGNFAFVNLDKPYVAPAEVDENTLPWWFNYAVMGGLGLLALLFLITTIVNGSKAKKYKKAYEEGKDINKPIDSQLKADINNAQTANPIPKPNKQDPLYIKKPDANDAFRKVDVPEPEAEIETVNTISSEEAVVEGDEPVTSFQDIQALIAEWEEKNK